MFKKIYKKVSRTILKEEEVDFDSFKLTVNTLDHGGLRYCDDLNYWSDIIDPIHKEIVDIFQPTVFLDIGANYGFTSLLHFSLNPNCLIIAVEASPKLKKYLEKNLIKNECKNYTLVSSVCSDVNSKKHIFSLNPFGSQDNRVIGSKGWKSVVVSSTTISNLLQDIKSTDFVMIKIDTQGFEEKIFHGGENFLFHKKNWIIKTEFAPKWLLSQGSKPTIFLEYLVDNFLVIELPKRTRFKGDSIKSLTENFLRKEDCLSFVSYIQSLAKKQGWCDLLIFPKDYKLLS